MTPEDTAFLVVRRTAKLGVVLAVAALLAACEAGGLNSQNASSPSASVGNPGAGSSSSIQSVPANPGSVPNGAGVFPANPGGNPR